MNESVDFEPELTEITERVWASLMEAPLVPRQPGQPGPAPGSSLLVSWSWSRT